MSSSTLPSKKIPQSISQRLQKLRAAMGRFVLIDGLSKLLFIAVLLILADLLFDRVFQMDLAQRGIMLVVMAVVLLAVIFFKLIKPFSKKVSDDALILQVESKNKDLQESVISAAQFSRGENFEQQGYSQSMVDATIRQGSQAVESVNFGKAIDGEAFARNMIILLASIVGLGFIGYGVATTDLWKTWFNRNILLTNDQWPRNTKLEIVGVEDGRLTLARGEDHRQLVKVNKDSKVTDVAVSIEFDDGNSRTTQDMRKTADLEHSLVFRNLTNEFRFRAVGGDDTTDWVEVNLVDPPGWQELNIFVEMPEYTGLGTMQLPPGGGPHSILENSTVTIKGKSNKPLQTANLKVADQQWNMEKNGDDWQLKISPEQLVGGKYTFDLADESAMKSSRPTSFTFKVKPDRAPSIRGKLSGIGGLVVPRARVPISYTVGDEFAITKMTVEHVWTGATAGSVPQEGEVDLTTIDPSLTEMLGTTEIRSLSTIDLEPLNIPTNVSLRLSINAYDNNTLTGPGKGKPRVFLLRVVTEDELRQELLRREIEQRKAFELILENQQKLIYDLQGISDQTNAQNPAKAKDVLDQLREAQRRQKLVGTNASVIGDRFEDFLAEALNNRLDESESEAGASQSYEVRYNQKIVQPIRELDRRQIAESVQLVELTQRAISYDAGSGQQSMDKANLVAALNVAVNKQNEVLTQMQKILEAMKKSETYQEIINQLIEIEKKEEIIKRLAQERGDDAGAVFDDEDDLFEDESMPENEENEEDDEKKDSEKDKSDDKNE